MTEVFANISEDARKQAELAWTVAYTCKTPTDTANMLNAFTNYYCSISDEEGIRDFLNFFFNMKMEELKVNENTIDLG